MFRNPRLFFIDMMINKLSSNGYYCYKNVNASASSDNIIVNDDVKFKGNIPKDKVSIIIPVWLATIVAAIVGVTVTKILIKKVK